ncbi:hypothetical protein [Nocardiopsis algeriensis]|uniref:Uncharacterized protein n=1 Tax=Nocardiopsis algeriensis TaxID=1478215 RepID=A0A841IRY2_9ACTN|nr:hypothetical protein [Nocardiopsis algeriensis]MBB6119041.1 hypothetical protein [Nocardiopsis algeriensis]
MSSKPAVSKAGPIGKDIKIILVVNLISILSLVLFAAIGLSVAAAV